MRAAQAIAPLLAVVLSATLADAQRPASEPADWVRHALVGYAAPNSSIGSRERYAGSMSDGVLVALRAESAPASRAPGLYLEGGAILGLRVVAGDALRQTDAGIPALLRGTVGFLRHATVSRHVLYLGAGATVFGSVGAGRGVCFLEPGPCQAAQLLSRVGPGAAFQVRTGFRRAAAKSALGIDLAQEFSAGDAFRRLFLASAVISLG